MKVSGLEKRIMILGGGENQLPLIRSAKALGYYVLVCDMRDTVEGVLLADEHIPLNYMEQEAVLAAARKARIDGIVSNSEPAMPCAAYVAQTLGLPGPGLEAVQTLISKSRFRSLQERMGVYAPGHAIVSREEELLRAARALRFPVIVKPTESSGTRGTTRLDAFDETALGEAFRSCGAFSRNGKVSVEEYVQMPSLQVVEAEAFVVGQDILWDGLYTTLRSPERPMLPMTYVFPSCLAEEQLQQVRRTVETLLHGAGVTLGQYNVEAYFTQTGEVFVIEINPRQGGNFLPQLVLEHSGVDLTRLLVSTAVGDMEYYRELKTFCRENRYVTYHSVYTQLEGVYQGICVDPALRANVHQIREFCHVGDRIGKSQNAGDLIAMVTLYFDTRQAQEQYLENIEKYVYADIR